ncbi:MAG: efflux RND transporter permease subunit [Deltaproteobacteria bacterium]|nr:efflux RND transporter permease subunit [Deltaproteobacteria bacterium]
MSLSDVSIDRPVLTWMLMLALATFGVLGFSRLGIDRYPDMTFPFVGVVIQLEGASPTVMEDEVIDELEEAFATIEGVRHIYSESATGVARVMMEFELEQDLDVAAQDVRDKLNMTMGELPEEIEPPVLGKADFSIFPIIFAPITTTMPATEATEYIDRHMKPMIESIPGAAGTEVYGAVERNVRIWIDPDLLRARQLAVSDVLDAIRREHVERPGGFVEGREVEWALKTAAEFRSLEDLSRMVVSWDGEAPIRLGDVARIEDGAEDVRRASHMNGKPGIAIAVKKQSDGNTVAIVDEFYRRMDILRSRAPEGIHIVEKEGFIDNSELIRESFEETLFSLVFGGLLAVFVVFIFMRRTRPTLIVSLAIPLSIVTTFGMIWIFDYTLNTMTLLGLTLAIGVVIDDAIIVLENIERHREGGQSAFEAARSGTREITLAAAAATFSVAAVFLPVAFATGQMGSFLTEFGVTVSVAVVISLLVALTITPMLAARMPPPKERGEGGLYGRLESGFQALEERYRQILDWSIASPGKTTAIAIASIVLAVLAGSRLKAEFFPAADTGFVAVRFRTPPGSSLENTVDILTRNEAWFLEQPEVASIFAAIGSTSISIGGPTDGMLNARLYPADQRKRTSQELMVEARKALLDIPGQEFSVVDPMGSSDREFEVEIVGSGSLEEFDQYASQMIDRLEAEGGMVDMEMSLRVGLPEARVVPDRDKAAALGVDAQTVADTVLAMIGGLDVASYREGEERHDVRMRMEKGNRDDLSAIGDLWVRARNGELVDMRNLVTVERGATAASITRTDRQRSVKVMGSLEGIALGDAVVRAQRIADEILPSTMSLRLTGDAEAMRESGQQFMVMMVLAVLVIYMVLAAQFESFTQPIIVMAALPFSMVGALGGLWLFDMSLNLFSMIGIVLLIGLVTKNSILLVDYANQLQAEGMTAKEAMRKAAPIRMRPVLMTALSMIFGVLPSALGIGPGAETRAPMGVATAAGMFTSMMLTLLIVPVFYLGLERVRARFAGRGQTAPVKAEGLA